MSRNKAKNNTEATQRHRMVRWLENRRFIAFAIVAFSFVSVGLVFLTNILNLWTKLSEDPSSADRIAAVKTLSEGIEKIKILLPFDQAFSDCLKRRSEPFETAVEACARERKLSQTDAINIIDRNIASLKLFFSTDELAEIDNGLLTLRYLAYEMQNNQLALEHWRKMGCPLRISFLGSGELSKLPRDKEGKTKCVLSVETFKSFLERKASNGDPFSALSHGQLSADRVKVFIIPGNDDTIDNYFLESNKMLYSAMLRQVDSLTPRLRALME